MTTYIDMWKTRDVEGYDLYCENIETPYHGTYDDATQEQVFEQIKYLARYFDVKECEVHIEVEWLDDGLSKGVKTFDGYIDEEYELMHEDRLLPRGTRVKMSDGRIGFIDDSDFDSSDIFRNINYYVYPLDDYDDYEMYLAKDLVLAKDDKLLVCEHCLAAIASREGNQATLTHYVGEENDLVSKCDWCGESGFDTLYELI